MVKLLFNFRQLCSILPLSWFIVQMLRNPVVKFMYIDFKNLPFRIHLYLFHFILFICVVRSLRYSEHDVRWDEPVRWRPGLPTGYGFCFRYTYTALTYHTWVFLIQTVFSEQNSLRPSSLKIYFNPWILYLNTNW